jgi:hypothetical protein
MEKIHELNKHLYKENLEIQRLTNNVYELSHGCSFVQAKAVDIFLNRLVSNYGKYIIIEPMYIIHELAKNFYHFGLNDYKYVVEKMIAEDYIEIKDESEYKFKIKTKGKELLSKGGFLELIKSRHESNWEKEAIARDEQRRKQQIDELQIETLKRGIKKMKRWPWFLLLNMILAIATTIGTSYIQKLLEPKEKNKSEQMDKK